MIKMYIRFWKLVLAWLIPGLRKHSATRAQARNGTRSPATKGPATHTPATAVDIAKRDLVNALDIQIAVLDQRRKYYQGKADMCTSTAKLEDKLKLLQTVAKLNVQIAQLEVKVLKLREEIDR